MNYVSTLLIYFHILHSFIYIALMYLVNGKITSGHPVLTCVIHKNVKTLFYQSYTRGLTLLSFLFSYGWLIKLYECRWCRSSEGVIGWRVGPLPRSDWPECWPSGPWFFVRLTVSLVGNLKSFGNKGVVGKTYCRFWLIRCLFPDVAENRGKD